MKRAKEIIPGRLYQGSHPAKWPEGKIDWIKENIDLVVLLAAREDPDQPALEAAGVTYWHFPVVDSHKTVDHRIPKEVVPVVVDWLHAGKRVLVCCLAGRSRSGATNALVLRQMYGLTGYVALERLRQRRPKAVKREGPEAFIRSLEVPVAWQVSSGFDVPLDAPPTKLAKRKKERTPREPAVDLPPAPGLEL